MTTIFEGYKKESFNLIFAIFSQLYCSTKLYRIMTDRINNYNTNIDTGLKVVKVDAKRIFKIFYLPYLLSDLNEMFS